jgi:hypothetical protein
LPIKASGKLADGGDASLNTLKENDADLAVYEKFMLNWLNALREYASHGIYFSWNLSPFDLLST